MKVIRHSALKHQELIAYLRSVHDDGAASFKLFDEDGNGELSEEEVERMLLMATRAVVRKRFNTSDETKRATGNTAVTIPDELRERIKQIVKEIFEKIDNDRVRAALPSISSETYNPLPTRSFF